MSIRVLLVEDHASFRDALEMVVDLQPDLRVVASMPDARDVTATVAASRPDVAVVDLDLPRGSGIEVIQAVRETSPQTACVVLTGLRDDVELGLAIEAGASAVLHKSAHMREVLDVVRRVHGGATILPVELTSRALRALARDRERGWYGRVLQDSLTGRELQILERLVQGESDREIAERFGIAPNTVATHVRNLMGKMAARSRLEAVVKAIRHGLVPPPA